MNWKDKIREEGSLPAFNIRKVLLFHVKLREFPVVSHMYFPEQKCALLGACPFLIFPIVHFFLFPKHNMCTLWKNYLYFRYRSCVLPVLADDIVIFAAHGRSLHFTVWSKCDRNIYEVGASFSCSTFFLIPHGCLTILKI